MLSLLYQGSIDIRFLELLLGDFKVFVFEISFTILTSMSGNVNYQTLLSFNQSRLTVFYLALNRLPLRGS